MRYLVREMLIKGLVDQRPNFHQGYFHADSEFMYSDIGIIEVLPKVTDEEIAQVNYTRAVKGPIVSKVFRSQCGCYKREWRQLLDADGARIGLIQL